MLKLIFISLALSISVFAFDASTDVSRDHDNTSNNSMSNKKDLSINKSKTKDTSKSKSETKNKTNSIDLKFAAQLTVLREIASLERNGVKPFSTCRLLTEPRQPKDFGLSCRTNKGYINTGKCNQLDTLSKNYAELESFVYSKNKRKIIKNYGRCGLYYGAVISQYLKTNKLNYEIKDKEIRAALNDGLWDLKDSSCSFNGAASSLLCGNISLDLNSDYKVMQYGIALYSANSFYGYELSKSLNKSLSKAVTDDIRMSKSKSRSSNMSKGFSMDSSTSEKISKKATNSMSVGKFID